VKGIEVSMLFGSLDQIHGTPFGRMIIGLSGSDERIEQAMDFLEQADLKMEVIGYVERNYAASDESAR